MLPIVTLVTNSNFGVFSHAISELRSVLCDTLGRIRITAPFARRPAQRVFGAATVRSASAGCRLLRQGDSVKKQWFRHTIKAQD